MKIVITGAGEVGTYLAKMLSKERHEIILIDEDKEKLVPIENNFDLLTITGSGVLPSVLKDAGIDETDLFVAVTPYESLNITSCTLAKELGAKKTVARIDNHEYLLPVNKARFEKIGVDSLIYPELLAAKEVVESLRLAGVRQVYEFAGGKVILAGIKIRDNASICGKSLLEVFKDIPRARVAAIVRNAQTIIPRGEEVFMDEDIAFFVTTKDKIKDLKKLSGKSDFEVKSLMIMGGSRIGVKVAQFSPDKYHIKIIEKDKNRIYPILDKLDNNALVINGDATDIELLKEEGIDEIDSFVAMTGNSEANVLACLAAKRLGVKKTVAEVENFNYMSLANNLGVGTLINKKLIAASHIYQLTLSANVSNLRYIATTDAEVIELEAKLGSKITKHPVKDLKLPTDVHLGAIVRDNEVIIIDGDTHIQAGDLIVLFCLESAVRKIEKLF